MKQKAPTVRDVAKKAGVSVATVSRVMNNKGYLSQEIKKQVRKAMDELGYVPNQIARSFYKKKTNAIGVIVPTIINPFFGELVYHIEKCAEQRGLKVLLCNSLNDSKTEMKYLKMLLENQVDGIIVGSHNDELEGYGTPNVPIIAVERFLDNKRVPTICSDNFEGGRLATTHLLELGYRELICFSGEAKQYYPANDRRVAFEVSMEAEGLPATIIDVSSFEVAQASKIIKHTLENNPKIDGIFATDDILASLVARELRALGKQINKDVGLVGFDGTDIMRNILPELTTIKQPIREMAKHAVENLVALIRQEKVPKMVILPVELLLGEDDVTGNHKK